MTPSDLDALQEERRRSEIEVPRGLLRARLPKEAAARLKLFSHHHLVLSGEGAGRVHEVVGTLAETAALVPDDEDLAAWAGFIKRNAHRIERGGAEALVQAALEEPPETAPGRAVVRWIAWSKYKGPSLRRMGAAPGRSSCELVLEGHDDVVFDVAWHPDGRHALSAASDGKVIVWDAERGGVLLSINVMSRGPGALRAGAKALAVHPSGRLVASGSLAGEVALWNIDTGSPAWRAEAHGGAVEALRFTRDGAKLVSAGGVSKRCDDAIVLWDSARGVRLAAVHGGGHGCRAAVILPDDRSLVAVGPRPEVTRWSLDDLTPLDTLRGLPPRVAALARASDDRALVAASSKALAVIDPGTLAVVATHETSSSYPVAAVPGGDRLLVSLGYDVGVFDLTRGAWEAPLRGSGGRITALAAHPDGGSVLCASEEGTVRRLSLDAPRDDVARAHGAEVTGLVVDPPRGRAISIGNDGAVLAWSLDRGAVTTRLRERSSAAVTCAIDATSGTFVTSDEAGLISVWDLTRDAVRNRFESRTYGMNLLAIAPGGGFVAMAGGYLVDEVPGSEAQATHAIRIREALGGELVYVLEGHEHEVTAIAFLPGGGFVSLDANATLRVWDAPQESCLRALQADHACPAMAAIPGVREVLVGGARIQRWEIDTGELLAEFWLGPHRARSLTVSPDGRTALTLGLDRALCVWALDSGELVARWESDLMVRACALADDRIVLGDDSGAVTFLERLG